MGATTKEIGSSSFNDMISSVDRRSEYVENRAGANVRVNNFLTPYTLDNKSSILNAPCGYSNGVYASLRPSDAFGPELVTHGTFDSQADVDYWQIASSRATKSLEDGFMRLTYTQTIGAALFKNNLVPTGRYKVTFRAKGTANTNFTSIGDNASINNNPEYAISNPILTTDWQEYEFRIELTQSQFRFYLSTVSTGDTLDIDDISVKEDISADFTFIRGTAATRVTKDGLVKDVQILSDDLVKNGNFEEIGPEEVSNGDFSQEGSEEVVNGGFDTDSDWNLSSTFSIDNNKLRCVSDGSYQFAYQNNVFTVGKTYKVTFDILDYVSGSIRVRPGGGAITPISANGSYTLYYTAGSSGTQLFVERNSACDMSITNISVKEVGQDWDFTDGASITDNGVRIVSDGTYQRATQYNILTVGKQYKVQYEILENNGGNLKIQTSLGISTIPSTVGTHTVYAEALQTFLAIERTAACDVTITNISVKEVGQNWTFGSGWNMGDNKAVFDTDDGDGTFQSTSILTLNNTYRITFDVNITDGVLRFESGAGDNFLVSSSGTYTHEFEADLLAIKFRRNSTPTRGYIDNISVIEITDDTNLPRIDYTNGTGALLLEPQSTNLITYSEDFSQGIWSKNNVTLISGFTSPAGDLSTYKLQPTQTSSVHLLNIPVTSSSVKTYSVFAKQNGYKRFRFNTGSSSNGYASFDLDTGSVIATGGTFYSSSSIEDYGDGWYKCSMTLLSNAPNNYTLAIEDDNGQVSFLGDGISSIYIWGAQVEQLPHATSYIPTNGSTVTRNQDAASRSGISNLINSQEGVLYMETKALADDNISRRISLSDGTSSNRILLYFNPSNKIQALNVSSGTTQGNMTFTTDIKKFNKIAFKYKENDFALFVNGVKVNTDTSGLTYPVGTLSRLGFDNAVNGEPLFSRTRSVAVFNEALTDEELVKITSTTQQEVFYEMRDKMQQIDADYYEFGDYTTRLKKLF